MLPGRTYTFDDIIGILKRRLFVIAIPVLLAGVATVAVLDRLPNRYRSSTLIMVVPQRVPESYVKSTVTARIEDRLQSLSQQLLSRTRLEGIIRDLNLYKAQQAQAADGGHRRADARGHSGAARQGRRVPRQLHLGKSPVAAQKVTDRLTSLFIEESLNGREVLAEATNEFLDTQLEDARRRLVAQEKQLEQYRMAARGRTSVAAPIEPAGRGQPPVAGPDPGRFDQPRQGSAAAARARRDGAPGHSGHTAAGADRCRNRTGCAHQAARHAAGGRSRRWRRG